jgi:outer membrane receptor protein involved in Fe transport
MSIPMLEGRSTTRRLRGALFGALVAAMLLPAGVLAQATGSVAGRVMDGRSGAAIEAAQVYLVGLNLGALSAANGRFLIVGVPAGTHQLRAERLGFATITQQVTVTAGQASAVEFTLEQQAIGLDEIVVTGEAGAARQREIGNAISSVRMGQIVEPTRDVQQLLGGRVAGAVITESTGSAGSGGFVRLRGINSVSMSNTPLLYIDGVRVRSDDLPRNYPRGDRSNRSGNVQPSPLSQINPEDIDRIEVIKGSAATSIYGTEASAGVIQIFTKKGQAGGRPQWSFTGSQTMRHVQKFGGENRDWIDTDGVVMGNSDKHYMEPWLRDAMGTQIAASVRGGLTNTSYFLSAEGSDQDFPMPNDFEKRVAVRGNVGFQIMSGLTMEWNTAFTKSHLQNTPSGDNAQGIPLNAQRPTTSYTGTVPTLRGNIDKLLVFDIDTYIDRFMTGLSLRHNVTTNLDHRFTVGYDRTYTDLRSLRPFGFILDPAGIVNDKRWTGEILTMDYAANYNLPLGEQFAMTFSGGGQAVQNEESSNEGTGLTLPGPSNPTVNSGAITLAFEDRQRVINAGFFLQNRLGWRDRLFLTVGLRVDGNSAFGESFGLQPYPKISASYVISDESFWPEALGTMKLRAAYGEAGRAPGAFDATRTWEASKYVGSSAFLPENLGDPDLGPERTAETELGFTAGLLSDRLTLDVTYFRHRTEDALFEVSAPPSLGEWNEQKKNVGIMKNSGLELSMDATMIERPNFGWDLGLIFYTLDSEVVSLGGAPAFDVGGGGWILEGESVPVILGDYVENPDEKADPRIVRKHVYGPSQPTHTITPSTNLRLPYGITLSARGEYLGGHFIRDANMYGQISRGETAYAGCIRIQEMDKAGRVAELTAMERFRCIQRFATSTAGDRTGPTNRGDFFKLRDVSVRIPLSFWSAVDNPSLTLSARNAYKWVNSDWWSYEPEVGCNGTDGCLVISQQEHIPPPATLTAAFRFGL